MLSGDHISDVGSAEPDAASDDADTRAQVDRARLKRERAIRLEAERIAEATTRRLYEHQQGLELLKTVATVSNSAVPVDEVFDVVIQHVCAHTGWPVGHALVLAQEVDGELVSAGVWHIDDEQRFGAFRELTEDFRFASGKGLPGRVLASATPAWIADLPSDANFPRKPAADAVGLRTALAFPVLAGAEVVAVLEFFTPQPADPDERLLELMAYVGTQVGRVIERDRANARLAHEAAHDSLTGLPNRRSLTTDLESRIAVATERLPLLLTMFDLDGFKQYNDIYGHPVGDTLLARIGQRLREAVEGAGTCYRMGGDEFCLLALTEPEHAEALPLASAEALTEHGEGFSVTVSYGSVLLPIETSDAAEALFLADRRMYASKAMGSRASAGRQSTDVLLKVMAERNPDLGTHVDEVTRLTRDVGSEMGLPDEQLAPLLQAAALHDVGKAAIPDEILAKPGALDIAEREFIRRHPEIGERIMGVAPALSQAAHLVRCSHEWFDGCGYPDGLSGEEIPLGARIIAVCDALDAMTAERPYRDSVDLEAAIAELRRCAGTQFDPVVVDAVCTVLTRE